MVTVRSLIALLLMELMTSVFLVNLLLSEERDGDAFCGLLRVFDLKKEFGSLYWLIMSLYKTKLCILYEKNGHCSKPNCTFAHGVDDLRLPGESSSFRGRRHNLDGDLRDKLGRHFSPERRPSLERSGRRVQRFNGHENPRSFEKRRDVDFRENRRFDERSDYAGGLKAGSRIEVREKDERKKFLGYNNVLEEQMGCYLWMRYSDFPLFSAHLWLSSTPGRRHNLDGDLRDKLGRHFSPERRPSLERSGRRVQRFNGHENPRSFEKRRDVDFRENRRFDERSDYAGGLKAGSRIEVREKDERKKFLGYNNVLEEQLKDVELDVKMLTDNKLLLEAAVERKAREADSLTSKIHELRTQLDREKEECKRSEARLQKLGTQLSTYLLGNEGNDREADIEIVSDEEKNGRNLRSTSELQNELHNTSSVSRKRHYVEQQYTTKESVQDALRGRGEEDKLENGKSPPSRWNRVPSKSFSEEESRVRNEEDAMNKSSSKEDTWKRRRLSSGTSSSNKVMSSTSMAARVSDEVAEFDEEKTRAAKGSPLISLPPPPPFRDAHFHGDEEEEVDVNEQRKADDVDSV
ncbi:hypothetical protein DY000_02042019 [Brassica cretica]|uniref:C3H1-type domain-containing protein n=1 Tax=Brassica cretica TaxID=69181 RepID=A0ABQ7BIB4_BRACR|nr:hypothetical protein DY000_02042019 [Brassica cretica]